MSDLTIDVVTLGDGVSFQCTGGVLFTFESEFTLIDALGESRQVDPENVDDGSAAALAHLVHQSVRSWEIDRDSTVLELRISDGAVIRAPADPDFEAWQVRTEAGELIVALPGGSVAEFPPPA